MERILTIPWRTGAGNILITEAADGIVTLSSDTPNTHLARSQTVRFYTLSGDAAVQTSVRQLGARVILRDNATKVLRDKNGLTLTVLKDG